MATYEEIYGKRVDVLSSDPTLSSAYEGQVWYNSTTGTLKTVVNFAAWASAGNLNTAVYDNTGAGTQDAALNVGGTESPSVARSDNTEEFNGTGWGNSGNLNTGRFALGGFGTTAAAIVAGGNTSPGGGTTAATESYNGTAWTSLSSPSNLNTSRQYMNASSVGTSTAGLIAGGTPPTTGATEEWNGSAWSESGDLSTARYSAATMGTQTAALAAGGETPYMANVEEYNGTGWTTGTNLPTNTANAYRVGNSTTDLYVAGGYTPSATQTTHKWDGSSWTTSGSMGRTASGSGGSFSGSPTAGLAFGGSAPPPSISTTEEFNVGINTITAAAWASGGTLPTGRGGGPMFAVGTQTATVIAAGANASPPPDYVNTTLEYNGTSWTSANAIGQPARNSVGSAGTLTAGLLIGGYSGTSGGDTTSEEYDGTNWTNGGALSNGLESGGSFGTQTAAVACAGTPVTGNPTKAEEYNGTGWTSISTVGTGRVGPGGFGTETAGVICGGMVGYPGSTVGNTEEYNGESWSEVNNLITARYTGGPTQAGTQTAGMYCGGNTRPAKTAVNEAYDGTTWYSDVSLPAAWDNSGGTGTRAAALISGGYNPSITTTTLEYTPSTETVAAKTLTTS